MTLIPRWRVALWLVIGMLFLESGIGRADTLVMPRDLVQYAKTMHCTPIADFYDRIGMVDPPYAYGVLPGEREESAALWCEKTERSDKPYLLVFMVKGGTDVGGCPLSIEWWNPTGGLSIDHRASVGLKRFRYVSDPEKHSPDVVIGQTTLIVSDYDGVSAEFLCFQGAWLFAISH